MPKNDKEKICASKDLCPIVRTSQVIGDLWVLLIIRDLLNGPRRFNQLFHALNELDLKNNISSTTLSRRLKELEAIGIIGRKVYAEVPAHTDYFLTKKGLALSTIIGKMKDFGEKFLV